MQGPACVKERPTCVAGRRHQPPTTARGKGGEEAIGASGLQTSRQPTCMVRLFTDALSIDTEADPQSEYHTASTGPTHT
jgi:hypothetical protein